MINAGTLLKEAQESRGITSAELARRLEKAPQQIHRWRMQDDLKLTTVVRACEAMDMKVSEFMREE
ncbi:MAG: helix-turn-helix domain-containing protein [Acidimicrobiales bacterium]